MHMQGKQTNSLQSAIHSALKPFGLFEQGAESPNAQGPSEEARQCLPSHSPFGPSDADQAHHGEPHACARAIASAAP